jgi:hypothetical protein
MKLLRKCFSPLLLLFFFACSQSTEEKNHFPVAAFLQEELSRIDSLPIAVIRSRETNGLSDTTVMNKKEFRTLAMQLMGIDLREKKYQNNYQELVLEDAALGNISIGYTTDDPDLPIRKIELNIDASTNKIKSIFAERQEKESGKLLIKKILWTSSSELMVNTSVYKEGQLLNNLTERYNWAIGN